MAQALAGRRVASTHVYTGHTKEIHAVPQTQDVRPEQIVTGTYGPGEIKFHEKRSLLQTEEQFSRNNPHNYIPKLCFD